jgi:hypothetical protein
VPDTLSVHVNREELHGLDVPNEFETTDSFEIRLQNHGESVHVHLHLDDALSEVARLEANNHHVAANSTRNVTVDVVGPPPARGRLKVVTAYGATTRYVDVVLEEPPEEFDPVAVDESLSKPKPRKQPAQSRTGIGGETDLSLKPELLVFALGAFALLLAVTAALVIDSMVILLGSLAILTGVLVAMYLLIE